MKNNNCFGHNNCNPIIFSADCCKIILQSAITEINQLLLKSLNISYFNIFCESK